MCAQTQFFEAEISGQYFVKNTKLINNYRCVLMFLSFKFFFFNR